MRSTLGHLSLVLFVFLCLIARSHSFIVNRSFVGSVLQVSCAVWSVNRCVYLVSRVFLCVRKV